MAIRRGEISTRAGHCTQHYTHHPQQVATCKNGLREKCSARKATSKVCWLTYWHHSHHSLQWSYNDLCDLQSVLNSIQKLLCPDNWEIKQVKDRRTFWTFMFVKLDRVRLTGDRRCWWRGRAASWGCWWCQCQVLSITYHRSPLHTMNCCLSELESHN